MEVLLWCRKILLAAATASSRAKLTTGQAASPVRSRPR